MPVTRTTTGKLPPQRSQEITTTFAQSSSSQSPATASTSTGTAKVIVSHKATPEEIKEKMEQQLRIQRAAHHQKRALLMQKQNQGNLKNQNKTLIPCFTKKNI